MQASPDSSARPEPALSEAGTAVATTSSNQHRLVKNTVYLTAAQAATVPIAVLMNALLGRYLGAEEFGYIYLAGTLCSFAVLALEWGQQGAVPALVARGKERAGVILGTSLAWRGLMTFLISGVLAVVCEVLGYGSAQKWAVALTFPVSVLTSFSTGFKDTIRGFERTDIPALVHVGVQITNVIAIVPVLLLGGRLRAVLVASLGVVLVAVLVLRVALRSLGVRQLTFDRNMLKQMFAMGTPFVFFELALVLTPNVNATFLAKLVPAEVTGWFGVSQKLIGLLIFPASALIGALYPTLCRLYSEDQAEFGRVTRNALYGTSLLAVPAAVGCGMFPELGVMIFDAKKFAGAADHLRVMSLFVFLVYFSMPLGTAILACNKQRAWALVQAMCIVVAIAGNPFLIPHFQRLTGNGAIGTCITLVVSELLVVGCGVALAPRGVFNGELMKSLAMAALSGAVMLGVAWLTKPISLFLAVPAALLGYAVVAYFSGAIQPSTVELIQRFVNRKLLRRA
jgi:O-antigen/teichoic acid export membrane protein